MTDDRIGEIWRLPENYCKPLAFGRAIEAECRGVPDYVWMIGTKGFMALFATEKAANDWQQMNGTNTPASYIQPVRIPVIAAAPKPEKADPVQKTVQCKHDFVIDNEHPRHSCCQRCGAVRSDHMQETVAECQVPKVEAVQEWKSCAKWPDSIKGVSPYGDNISTDTHATKEQAEGVCEGLMREFRSLVHASAAPQPDRLKSEPVAGPDFCDKPTRPALEAVFRDRPEYFEPDCECGAVASEHCPACEPVAQEPVAFYIYKETAPRLGIQNVVADSLPWVYDQDPSSGFSARLKVYLAPPDQTAEIERLREELRYEKMNTEVWRRDSEGKLEDRTEAYHRIATLEAALRLLMSSAVEIDNATDAELEEALECGDAEVEKQANAWLVARAALAAINKALGEE